MDFLLLLLISFLCAFVHLLTSHVFRWKSRPRTILPPGPRPLPIIGNILALGKMPHRALADLSKTYGPLMTLKLGSVTTVVISSPEIAKEALQKHDLALSSRTVPSAARVSDFHKNSMVWLPASTRWKNLRKIAATQMFTSQKLEASQALRKKKVQELLDHVEENCKNGQAVDIGGAVFTTVLNLISNSFFSLNIANYNSTMSQEFSYLVMGIMEEAGRPNLADYFPILRFVDPQGVCRKINIYSKRFLQILDGIVNERRTQQWASKVSHDVLDALLVLANENKAELSYLDIQNLLLDFFIAGTDTATITVEWAMTELLMNPDKLAKAKLELKEVSGTIQESDISKYPYIQAIVKETFRLHPPASFLIPHKAEFDVEIHGYTVPKNAQILVNIWAIGHNPTIWPDANSFKPERFLGSKIDVKGTDFELIPFGAGRRICPGLPLAHRMVHLMLASLIHSYDWKLADTNLDMSESFGFTLHKCQPLRVIPIKM